MNLRLFRPAIYNQIMQQFPAIRLAIPTRVLAPFDHPANASNQAAKAYLRRTARPSGSSRQCRACEIRLRGDSGDDVSQQL